MELKFKHFIFLNVLDIILTWYAITYQGLNEGNPILSLIFQEFGLITGLVLIKLLGLMLIYGLVKHTPNIKIKYIYNTEAQKIGITTICLLMVLVVANNIYKIISTFQL